MRKIHVVVFEHFDAAFEAKKSQKTALVSSEVALRFQRSKVEAKKVKKLKIKYSNFF
jgi:hypothetical protein